MQPRHDHALAAVDGAADIDPVRLLVQDLDRAGLDDVGRLSRGLARGQRHGHVVRPHTPVAFRQGSQRHPEPRCLHRQLQREPGQVAGQHPVVAVEFEDGVHRPGSGIPERQHGPQPAGHLAAVHLQDVFVPRPDGVQHVARHADTNPGRRPLLQLEQSLTGSQYLALVGGPADDGRLEWSPQHRFVQVDPHAVEACAGRLPGRACRPLGADGLVIFLPGHAAEFERLPGARERRLRQRQGGFGLGQRGLRLRFPRLEALGVEAGECLSRRNAVALIHQHRRQHAADLEAHGTVPRRLDPAGELPPHHIAVGRRDARHGHQQCGVARPLIAAVVTARSQCRQYGEHGALPRRPHSLACKLPHRLDSRWYSIF